MKEHGEAGFTLVESLVAFAILSAAIVLSFQSFGDSLHRLKRSQDARQQLQGADTLMQQLLQRKHLQPGQWIETWDGQEWRVTVTAKSQSTLLGASAPTPLLLVRVEAMPQSGSTAVEAVRSAEAVP